jgi:hypothetical protein
MNGIENDQITTNTMRSAQYKRPRKKQIPINNAVRPLTGTGSHQWSWECSRRESDEDSTRRRTHDGIRWTREIGARFSCGMLD